mmetsp:Transcript_28702/g.77728  ORF Transcript_28702/g.77728 Transcript_28702/m.77728 type:complete len:216 (+) Transcript_28702:3847-4494(+)
MLAVVDTDGDGAPAGETLRRCWDIILGHLGECCDPRRNQRYPFDYHRFDVERENPSPAAEQKLISRTLAIHLRIRMDSSVCHLPKNPPFCVVFVGKCYSFCPPLLRFRLALLFLFLLLLLRIGNDNRFSGIVLCFGFFFVLVPSIQSKKFFDCTVQMYLLDEKEISLSLPYDCLMIVILYFCLDAVDLDLWPAIWLLVYLFVLLFVLKKTRLERA